MVGEVCKINSMLVGFWIVGLGIHVRNSTIYGSMATYDVCLFDI